MSRMTTAILQTPLEVILFFTSLVNYGVGAQSFQAISESLKKDQFIRQSEGFDEARLSPESLQNLYLTLLRDELREQREKRRSTSPVQENGASNSRKRKLSSPPLVSMNDAQQHEKLLPALVNKLYIQYRDQAITSIKEEEENYRTLHSQLLKQGQDASKAHANGEIRRKSSSAPSERWQGDQQPPESGAPDVAKNEQQQSQGVESQREVISVEKAGEIEDSTQRLVPDPNAETIKNQNQWKDGKRIPSTQISSSSSLESSRSTQDLADSSRQLGRSPKGSSSLDRSQLQAAPGSQLTTSTVIPSSSSPAQTPSSSAGALQLAPDATSDATAGTFGSTASTASPLEQLKQATAYPGPRQSQYPSQPVRQPHPHRGQALLQHRNAPQTSNFGQLQPGQSPVSESPGSQPSSKAWQQTSVQDVHGENTKQTPFVSTPSNQLRIPGQITPMSSSASRWNLPPIDTSSSSTRWKTMGRMREKTPERPPASPLRIELDDSEFEFDEDSLQQSSRRSPGYDSSRATPTDKEDTPTRPNAGRGRGRGGRPRGSGRINMTRPGSASASTRTRSRSASLQQEELERVKKAGRGLKIDPETPAGDENPLSAPSSSAGTPLPTASRRGRSGTIRGTDSPAQVRPVHGHKRKRTEIDIGSPSSMGPGTPKAPVAPTKPGHVLAVRNLPRIAATILNDVTTHKLASMFQKPISEREAPGYRNFVYQPQDLKTIRSMLSAGVKVIAAADSTAQESGTPLQNGPSAGTVWLERSPDVMPPRAIVNSGQLETEICRIFANAVMFNPDLKKGIGASFRNRYRRAEAERRLKLGQKTDEDQEDSDEDEAADEGGSLVNDAREMFRDVEKQLAGWRAAERTSGGEGQSGEMSKDESMAEESKDEDEAAAATEGEEGRPARRRRLQIAQSSPRGP